MFLLTDNPLAYLAVIGLVAVGFGRIYIFGSRNLYKFKMLFDDVTGRYPEEVAKFIFRHLGKYLENYSLSIEPVSINLASEQALRLLLDLVKMDDNENKIMIDISNSYTVKYFVNKAVIKSKLPSYIFAPRPDGGAFYVVDMKKDKRSYKYLGEAYAFAIKYAALPLPLWHLYLMFTGMILAEATLRIQKPPKHFFTPTPYISFPFSGLGKIKPHVGVMRKVALIGCGALGTFYAIQLALMQNMQMLRIKKLVFVDPDEVELVNFNRQVLFWGDTLGEPKAKIMAQRYKNMVYDKVETEYYVAKFSEVSDKLRDVDLIIEGVDNWAARKEIAKFAVRNKIPLLSSGVEVLNGHATYYLPKRTYCPFHSMDLENKYDPPGREGCLVIEPSVIFTNITVASMGILTSLVMDPPLNGVIYYSLTGLYEKYKRFHLEKFSGSCGD